MNHIELFAGCGGLSLGLEKAGFELSLANELSPMAAETFAFNLLGEDFESVSKNKGVPQQTLWLSSKHPDLKQRLRENPFEYPDLGNGYSDLPENPLDLKGKLVVGNIIHLNQVLREQPLLNNALRSGFGDGEIDLVSGGPPCQSFSMAGLRRKDCDKNTLPWEFVQFVEHAQPRIATLENVTGILRAFKEDGKRYYAWFEVAKAFASVGYIPLCLHVNARLAGVPQNRPRFIMIAIRNDVYDLLEPTLNKSEQELLTVGKEVYHSIRKSIDVSYGSLPYFDVNREQDLRLFKHSFLSPLIGQIEVSVKQAIGDLQLEQPDRPSSYVSYLNKSFEFLDRHSNKFRNHEPRSNGPLVQRRFRLYQVMHECGKEVSREVFDVLKLQSRSISDSAWETLRKFEYLLDNNEHVTFGHKKDFVKYLQAHPTKKQTQRALNKDKPAPAALSIPDDACHYSPKELRTLTVREMARIQSFPDNFEFRSKVTTGGKMRRFEVPQYTQVGNAVPPLLGVAIGKVVSAILRRTT